MDDYLDRRVALQDGLLGFTADYLQKMGFPHLRGSGSLLDGEKKKIDQSTPLTEMSLVYGYAFSNINGPEHRIVLVFTKAADGNPQVSIHTNAGEPSQIIPVKDKDVSASVGMIRKMIKETIDGMATGQGNGRK